MLPTGNSANCVVSCPASGDSSPVESVPILQHDRTCYVSVSDGGGGALGEGGRPGERWEVDGERGEVNGERGGR